MRRINGEGYDVDLSWHKSSYSLSNWNCVETTRVPTGDIAVRDSKNIGAFLVFSEAEWRSFIDGIKSGEFGRQVCRARWLGAAYGR
jgi:Domain of unknown function (DUF397)